MITWLFPLLAPLLGAPTAAPTPFQDPQTKMWGYRVGAEVIAAPQFEAASTAPKAAKVAVARSPKTGWHFVGPSGDLGVAFNYDNGADPFIEGRARIQGPKSIGVIDDQGQVIVPVGKYVFVAQFNEHRAAVCTGCKKEFMGEHWRMVGGHWGYIDRQGTQIGALSFGSAGEYEKGRATVTRPGTGSFQIGLDGKRINAALQPPSPSDR